MLREFDADADVVRSAIQTVASVLGAPDPGFTKKVVRWERPTISVNLFREARKRACLCVAGANISTGGEIDWALDGRPLRREAIECAWLVFGQSAFRRWTPARQAGETANWDSKLNVALWDTLLYAFAFYEKRQIVPAADAIREEFLDLMTSDPVFVDYIGRTTDKPDRVQYRARAWLDRLERVINTPACETRTFTRKLKDDLHAADPTCSICSQRIPTADDAEVDHVLHYWRGGATIPENARLTHRYCNRVRGGRN